MESKEVGMTIAMYDVNEQKIKSEFPVGNYTVGSEIIV